MRRGIRGLVLVLQRGGCVDRERLEGCSVFGLFINESKVACF